MSPRVRLVCAAAAVAVAVASSSTALPASSSTALPCDIYGSTGTPCVAAHSMARALYADYDGPLYQVLRLSDNATADIGVLAPGGIANSASQDAFCGTAGCNVSRIYDQSPRGNHLDVAPAGGTIRTPDHPVSADGAPITLNGRAVYGAFFNKGNGYRRDNCSGTATGNEPETIYVVIAGDRYNEKCCFDYGNAERNNGDDGAGSMEAVYFGNSTHYAKGPPHGTVGPWIMADLESGLWAGGSNVSNPTNTAVLAPYIVGMVKGKGAEGWTIKAGDATTGPLELKYDGPRPYRYQPMKLQGAIILGIGGDNSDGAIGTWFEGVMTAGYSTDAADEAVMASIVAAGFGK